jgi:LPXTG-site transpeptidase (sortase) family protein
VRVVHERDCSVTRKNLFRVTERCLGSAVASIGALILALAVTAVLEGWFYQWSGHRQLNATLLSGERVHAAGKKSDARVNPRPARGMLLAKLQVPRLNMSVVVLEGSDDGTLKKGPGHIEETALPGELGNVGIAGHRDTHFRPLRNIRINDKVIVTTTTSTIHYFIDTMDIIHPSDMGILDPTEGPTLTLVTCYPFEFIGNAPMRYVIRATPRRYAGGSSTYATR